MRQWLSLAVSLATIGLTVSAPWACGRTAVVFEAAPPPLDAGNTGSKDAEIDARRPDGCPSGAHRCDGICVPENAESCGARCSPCAAPPPNGAVACVGGTCALTCDDGYVACEDACCAPQVTAGTGFTCLLDVAGDVRCWGDNREGMLGDGTFASRRVPTPVVGLPRATAIAAYGTHACAITIDGAVWCWGSNPFGVLGGRDWPYGSPRQVEEISSGATLLTTGDFVTCAFVGAEVLCWGVLDRDMVATRPTPIDGFSSGKPRALTAGGHRRVCALSSSGGVKCWGGPLVGDGTDTWAPAAVDVPEISFGVQSVSAAGDGHTCVARGDGTVACWGDNGRGELGVAEPASAITPVDAQGFLGSATGVAAGGAFTCALTAEGGVQCWGGASFLLPSSGTASDAWRAREILGFPARVLSIAAGDDHACAVLQDHRVACWGSNEHGELGDGTEVPRTSPVIVQGL